MTNTLTRIINHEKTILEKKNEKPLQYLKIQESLPSENLREHFLCQGIFLCFSLP